mmetsp:Transcript_343/g.1341  ORF Transcript_343/g.1341 Transcript_343/m.1341 type:complete len:279 (+) Transcript_343:790-1626(+)
MSLPWTWSQGNGKRSIATVVPSLAAATPRRSSAKRCTCSEDSITRCNVSLASGRFICAGTSGARCRQNLLRETLRMSGVFALQQLFEATPNFKSSRSRAHQRRLKPPHKRTGTLEAPVRSHRSLETSFSPNRPVGAVGAGNPRVAMHLSGCGPTSRMPSQCCRVCSMRRVPARNVRSAISAMPSLNTTLMIPIAPAPWKLASTSGVKWKLASNDYKTFRPPCTRTRPKALRDTGDTRSIGCLPRMNVGEWQCSANTRSCKTSSVFTQPARQIRMLLVR